MHVAKDSIEVRIEIPGAILRQRKEFGSVPGLGPISAEFFSLAEGIDTTGLFVGLKGDMCQSPHWGFVLKGQVTTTDAEGRQETVGPHDLFYWPPGHNVRVDREAEIIMFSPQHEHSHVLDHMKAKLSA